MKTDDYRIKISTLRKLPSGFRIQRVEHAADDHGEKHLALLVAWVDNFSARLAHFDIHTGEYLGEA